jgi:hypothetical protein
VPAGDARVRMLADCILTRHQNRRPGRLGSKGRIRDGVSRRRPRLRGRL